LECRAGEEFCSTYPGGGLSGHGIEIQTSSAAQMFFAVCLLSPNLDDPHAQRYALLLPRPLGSLRGSAEGRLLLLSDQMLVGETYDDFSMSGAEHGESNPDLCSFGVLHAVRKRDVITLANAGLGLHGSAPCDDRYRRQRPINRWSPARSASWTRLVPLNPGAFAGPIESLTITIAGLLAGQDLVHRYQTMASRFAL